MHSYNQSLYQDQSPGMFLFYVTDHGQTHRHQQSRQQINVNPNSASLNPPEFKVPEVQYLNQHDSSVNFKTQTLKLIQANAVLTELIKDTLVQKYSLTQKIIQVSQKIRRLENPHLTVPQSQSTVNFQQGPSHSLQNVASSVGQFQR